ncbi:MAG: hypothetical protein JSV61_07645 [Anaerolineales bacterium]|nr:MAG: hypothetical protein JSV61_07645 [Anaerolineales bacterium]
MPVYKVKDKTTTNLRSVKNWLNKEKTAAEFEPYGQPDKIIKLTEGQKVEVAGPGKGTAVYGTYDPVTKKPVDMNKVFYLVTGIKGTNAPALVKGVDLYVYAEDVEYVP